MTAQHKLAVWGIAVAASVLAVSTLWKNSHSDARALRNHISPYSKTKDGSAPISSVSAGLMSDRSKGDSHDSVEAGPDHRERLVDGGWLVRLDRYREYLDTVCDPLTVAEENQLIQASHSDPRVLVGLIFAGSERVKEWLKLALATAPNDPLVHYAVLSRSFAEFDRLQSALELSKLAPEDAWPLQVAALETIKRGDRNNAVAYLEKAAQRSSFSTYTTAAQQAAIDVLQMAGRSESDARTRVFLQQQGQIQALTAMELGKKLGLLADGTDLLLGNDAITALVIQAHEKAIDAPGFDFASYDTARTMEVRYLHAIATAAFPRLSEYLSAPVSELLASAESELQQLEGVLPFAQDKPGIHMRLSDSEKSEFINRIATDGETSAYLWAYKTRPDIFRLPDFVPQGMPREYWAEFVKH